MRKFSEQQIKMLNVLQFFIVFNILAIPMYFIILNNITFHPLQDFLASLTASALRMQKISATSSRSFITLVDQNDIVRGLEVSFDSTGWKSLYALTALLIATPLSNIKRKLHFLLFALPGIFLLNFLRIWSTIWYSFMFGWQNYDIVHTLLWREGLIGVVVLFWFLWLKEAVKTEKSKPESWIRAIQAKV